MNRESANTGHAGAEREGGVGVAQVVQVAQGLDSDALLHLFPAAAVGVAEVEVAPACVRNTPPPPRGRSWSSASSAIACSGTARTPAGLRCLTRPFAYARRIWTTAAARSTSPCSSANSSEGRSPVAAANTTIGLKFAPSPPPPRPRIEWPLLPQRRRESHALGRVVVDQLPGNRPIQHLQRLESFESMPLRRPEPPRADLPGESSARRTSPRPVVAFPAKLRDAHALTLMRVQVLLDPLAGVSVTARRRDEPGELVCSALCASASPTCHLKPRRTAACNAIPIGPGPPRPSTLRCSLNT